MRLYLLLLFILFTECVKAQFFEITFGDTMQNCTAVSIIQLSDGNVVAATNNDSAGNNIIKFFVFDTTGTLKNTVSYAANNENASKIIRLPDDKILLAGSVTDPAGNTDGLLIKTDTTGFIYWRTNIGRTTADEFFQTVTLTQNGEIVAGGQTPNLSGNGNAGYLAKTDSSGGFIWDKMFSAPLNSYIDAVVALPLNKLIISGDRQLPSFNYTNYTLCTDDSANILWDVPLPNPFNNGCKNDLLTSSGEIIIVGESSTANPIFDPAITRIDTAGTVKWSYIYTGSPITTDALFDVTEPVAENYIAAGYGGNPVTGSADLMLLRFDSAGTEAGRIFFGDSSNFEIGYSIITDNWKRGCFIGGTAVRNGINRGYLVFTGLMGINTGVQSKKPGRVNLYPSPASRFIYIDNVPECDIYIYNPAGQLAASYFRNNGIIPVDMLPDGIYIAVIRSGNDTYTGRISIYHH